MGGGIGLGCHASHRVICDSTQIAMPECSIGLMHHADGNVITDTLPEGIAAKLSGLPMMMDFVDTLARLHVVDWRAVGPAEFGRPQRFNARHLKRMEAVMNAR